MINDQFLVPSKIDIPLILTSLGYSDQYQYDHQDKYNYILHKILEGRVFNRGMEADDYTVLNFGVLKGFLGIRYTKTILTELLKLGIIQRNFYIVGKKSFAYRIAPRFVSKSILRDIFKTETMGRKLGIQRATYQKQYATDTTWKNLTQIGIKGPEALAFIDSKLDVTLARLKHFETFLSHPFPAMSADSREGTVFMDDMGVKEAQSNLIRLYSSFLLYWSRSLCPFLSLSSMYSLMSLQGVRKAIYNKDNQGITLYQFLCANVINKHSSDKLSILKIATGDFYMEQPDKDSRLFTNVSSLATDLRPFLYRRTSNSVLSNMDIRNSQPYLFSLLLNAEYQGSGIPKDVRDYIQFTANGSFYEHMMSLLDVNAKERQAFKRHFFATIFFCNAKHSRGTKEGKVFNQHFPHVYKLINKLKEDGHAQLAIQMQRAEAAVILKTIGGELTRQRIWFATIHDSVVVQQEHAEATKALILDAFMKAVGIAPTVKEEPFTTT